MQISIVKDWSKNKFKTFTPFKNKHDIGKE